MEQIFKKIVITAAIAGLIAFVLNLLVDNPYTHRIIRTAINEKIREATHITLDFKAVKASIVPPGVDLFGVHVATDVAPDSPLVSASHVKARLSLWALFLGEFRLSRLEAGDLALVWPPPWNFKGFLRENVTGPPAPDGPVVWPPDVDIPVDRLVLQSAKIYLEVPVSDEVPLRQEHFVTSLIGLDLDLEIESIADMTMQLAVTEANAALGPSSFLEGTRLEAEVRVTGDNINASRLVIDGERLKLNGSAVTRMVTSGRKRQLDEVQVSLQGTADADLSLLGTYLDLTDTRGATRAEISLGLDIPVESSKPFGFRVAGSGQFRDGYLDGFRLLDTKARFEITPEAIRFPEMDIIIGETSYGQASGEILFNDSIDYKFTASPTGLRLMDLLDALQVSFDMVDTAIHSPDLTITGKGSPFVLNTRATALFSDIKLPATPYDQSKYPVSPQCLLDFNLAVTSKFLDFTGTHGQCFHPVRNEARMPAPGQLGAPAGASASSPLRVAGMIHFDEAKGLGLSVDSDSFQLPLAQYFAQLPLQGDMQLRTRIHGPFDRVLIDAGVSGSGAGMAGLRLGRLQAETRVDGTTISWKNVRVNPEKGGSLLARSGQLRVEDVLHLQTTFEVSGIPAASFTEIMGDAAPELGFATDIIHAEGEFSGPLIEPLRQAKARLRLRLGPGTWENQRLYSGMDGEITTDSGGMRARDIMIRSDDLALRFSVEHKHAAGPPAPDDPLIPAGLSLKDHYSISFNTAEADTAAVAGQDTDGTTASVQDDHLGALPFAGAILREAGITGRIRLKGKIAGPLDTMQGSFQGALLQPTLLGSTLSPVNFRGFVKNGRIDTVMDHSGNSLEGRFSVNILEDGVPYEWFFAMNRMDLRFLGTTIFFADPRNYAYLTADWRMRGQFNDFWRSTGEFEIRDIRAKYVQDIGAQTKILQIRQEQPVTLLFTADKGWRFAEDQDLYLSGRNVQLRLTLPENKPPENLNIRLESIIDMSILREFSQEIDTASGKIRVIADIKGPVTAPKFEVEATDLKPNPFIAATWTPVTIGIADIRPAFRNIRLRVLYRDERLIIDSIAADKGSGTVSASGAMEFGENGSENSRIDLDFNDATIIYPVAFLKSFETQITGSVSVSGNSLPLHIGGDLVINKARSTKEVDIRDEIINALRQKQVGANLVSEKPSIIFDLNVKADQSINIHNRNLQSVLSTDLQIKGNDIAPVVAGQVEVNRGKFIYKRDFQITRGLVNFDDPVRPDPSLDILAVSEVDAYRVYISISGKASNPTVEFSVDPPVRESGSPISKLEILVLLSRGKLPEETRSLGQETEKAAASEAANLILGQFEEPVEKLFDLSGQSVVRNVYIDTHPSADGNPVPRLNLPLDLGEDFDVVFRADQTTSELSTEYSVHDNITFSGVVERRRADDTTNRAAGANVDGDARVNLKFRFSFE